MSRWSILEGDCLDVLRRLPEASFDACVTDPPAGIGFMGAEWDGDRGGRDHWIAWLAERMSEVRRVLKPGAYALVWGLPRTSHWTACGIEDAGFQIRDRITHIFGQGWPKSKIALKPAGEDWWLARAPGGEIAELNIDACRIAGIPEAPGTTPPTRNGNGVTHGSMTRTPYVQPSGRWPANVMLSHAPSCEEIGTRTVKGDPRGTPGGRRPGGFGNVGADAGDGKPNARVYPDAAIPVYRCAPGCPVAELDEQSGELTSGAGAFKRASGIGYKGSSYGEDSRPVGAEQRSYGDTGGASRFFYVGKAQGQERHRGTKHTTHGRNKHTTVKPVDLMRYLCRLVTPPGGRIIDPFVGSGTTVIAGLAEGFSVEGIEQDPQHAELARARVVADMPLFNRVLA